MFSTQRLLLFVISLSIVSTTAKAACTSDLQVYSDAVQGKPRFGFLYEGHEIIPAQFEEVGGDRKAPFCDGLAVVKKEGKWGYVDKRGNVVVNFEYDLARPFDAGVAVVRKANAWSLLSREGKGLCSGEPFYFIGAKSEGHFSVRALTKSGDIKFGFVDGSCRAVGQVVYESTGEFHLEVAPVQKNGKWIWLDASGVELGNEAPLDDKPDFWANYWTIRRNRKTGVVGFRGKELLPAIYSGVSCYEGGIFGVRNDESRYAFYDVKEGRFLTKFLFREIQGFSEGLAPVRVDEPTPEVPNTWGFIDLTGAWAISPRYIFIERGFEKGKAIVWLRENIYVAKQTRRFIDKTGNYVNP